MKPEQVTGWNRMIDDALGAGWKPGVVAGPQHSVLDEED